MAKKLILILLLFFNAASAQQSIKISKVDSLGASKIPLKLTLLDTVAVHPYKFKVKLNYPVLAVTGMITATSIYLINDYYAHTWWRNNRTSFKFKNDWKYALWIDKFGHAFGTTFIAHGISSAMEAGNVPTIPALWIGAAGALALQLYVEIQDGYGPKWGFSPGDAAADLIGASYYVAQFYYPYLKNFQFRFSYFPSKKFLNGEKKDHNFSDDYEGQKLWISMRMKNILPKSISKYWPDFLMLAFGYGVSDLDGRGGGIKKFFVGLDFDAETLPLHGRFWNFVKNTLNIIHFPLPGIRISPNAAFLVFAY